MGAGDRLAEREPLEKLPGESLAQSVSFSDVLTESETITSGDVVVRSQAGQQIVTGMVTNTVAGASSITFTVVGGAAGSAYWIDVLGTLNTSEIIGFRIPLRVL